MAPYKDLQRVTGLSLATISKYYNGGTVRPRNAQAIEAAARDLDFRPNAVARNLMLPVPRRCRTRRAAAREPGALRNPRRR